MEAYCTTCTLFFFFMVVGLRSADVCFRGYMNERARARHTFHSSSSFCLANSCSLRSFSTVFNPSVFVFNGGRASLTFISTRTPLIMRKHFLSPERGARVSNTALESLSVSNRV